ncbi:MAG: hypothetical protein HEP71_06510 [Roseivirga sp.]|nr:hypothetical protein [Roseivirga sp.]
MKVGDTIFCKNESVYEEHISIGTAYEIHDIKKNTVRIRGALRNRLVWLPKYCFSKKEVVAIKKIKLDDKIRDPLNDCIEVTVTFKNGKKRWTNFTTVKYLNGLLNEFRDYLIGEGFIILKEISKESVETAVMDLYRQDELKQQTKKL